ncbi:MAG TPA: hypothetical protein DDY49_12795 [Paenibacillaceae bacterium]|nr:hypothetical protein [Paenibacillaceae bacterium]
MKFYEFTKPDYLTDFEDMENNPVKLLSNIAIPSIVCKVCGQWASSDRIRKDFVFSDVARKIIEKKVIPVEKWKQEISILAKELSIPYEILTPSVKLGMPKGEVKKNILNDFIHVFPGIIWIKAIDADKIKRKGFTGIKFVKVNIKYKKKNYDYNKDNELMEIVVTGKAWRKDSDIEKITVCNICGRTIFPNPNYISIDEKKWDKTDFFTLDCNPNRIFITERVYDYFKENKFTNYRCIEIK